MKNILTAIFYLIIIIDLFVASPIGFLWDTKLYDEGKPSYGGLFLLATAIPALILGKILGYC